MYAGEQAIEGLYKAMMDEPKLLSSYFYEQLQKRPRHRVIADCIAGMSDRYALELYKEIYGRI